MPYLLLPNSLGIEPRHFYTPGLAGAFVLAILADWGLSRTKHNIGRLMTVALLGFLVLENIYHTQRMIRVVYIPRSTVIRQVYVDFRTLYPSIPKRAVFIAEGDPIPLQFGVGYLLLFSMNPQRDYSPFLRANTLWNIAENGYHESEGVGFGYFSGLPAYLADPALSSVPPDGVFSFSYDANTGRLTDTTSQTREHVRDTVTERGF